MEQNKIYCGNFVYATTEDDLRELFEPYGSIKEIAVIMDRVTGQAKGFAFITFEDSQSAQKALAKNGEDFGGRPLRVNMATEKPARGGGGGGRGGRGGGRGDDRGWGG